VAARPETPLILKRASRLAMASPILKPFGLNQDDFSVLEDGVIVGRIFLPPVAPQDRPWMWASWPLGHIRRAAHGYEATREAAMAAFAKSWRC
jgi:hypothetical protein